MAGGRAISNQPYSGVWGSSLHAGRIASVVKLVSSQYLAGATNSTEDPFSIFFEILDQMTQDYFMIGNRDYILNSWIMLQLLNQGPVDYFPMASRSFAFDEPSRDKEFCLLSPFRGSELYVRSKEKVCEL